MNPNDILTRRARTVVAAAQTVALTAQISRRKMECLQLIARYRALGLEAHETPGLRAMLGGLRSLIHQHAIAQLDLTPANPRRRTVLLATH